MNSTFEELPLSVLVEDLAIYPRHVVDAQHVSSLTDALRAGTQLPPLVAERKSKRLVDGWHRYRALRKIVGESGTVKVELRDYESEADVILDAISLNSAHGRRLDRMDQVRAVLLAEKAGAPLQAISVVLHIPETRVEQLRVRIAQAPVATGSSLPGDSTLVLKRPAFHLRGQTLTKEQAEAHNSMPGTSLLLPAKQLRLALSTGLVDPKDEGLYKELRALARALGAWLTERSKKAA